MVIDRQTHINWDARSRVFFLSSKYQIKKKLGKLSTSLTDKLESKKKTMLLTHIHSPPLLRTVQIRPNECGAHNERDKSFMFRINIVRYILNIFTNTVYSYRTKNLLKVL